MANPLIFSKNFLHQLTGYPAGNKLPTSGALVSFDPLDRCDGDTQFDCYFTFGYRIRDLLCFTTQSIWMEPLKVVAQMDKFRNVDEGPTIYYRRGGTVPVGI